MEWRERLGDRLVIASISGGKDSAAMSLWLKENDILHHRVFIDTGWEADATYSYIHDDLQDIIGPIEWISAPKQMAELTRHKKTFPSRLRRWCTEELKVRPMAEYLRQLDDDHVNAVGVRRIESKRRSLLDAWEWNEWFDCETWRPVLGLSDDDVIALHTRHGLKPNPLYLQGADRVGCWPCIYASKRELRLLERVDPQRVERLASLERELSDIAQAPRAWFQNPMPQPQPCRDCKGGGCKVCKGRGTRRYGEPWPIKNVIKWASRKVRHGKLGDEILDDPNRGCMRWGLCETASPQKEIEMRNQLDLAIVKDTRLPMPLRKKPILKYVGGKRWLIDYVGQGIWKRLASTGGRYIEPFLGGGAVAMWLGVPNMLLSEWEPPIVELYQALIADPGKVLDALRTLVSEVGVDEESYYLIRSEVPDTLEFRAARMVYLNRLGYNGLYRVNKKGQFNVPFGKKKIPKDPMKPFPVVGRFFDIQKALKDSELIQGDFEPAIARAGAGDVVLADPPYIDNYDQYTANGFSLEDHERLTIALYDAHERGATIIANNSDNEFSRAMYGWAPHVLTVGEARAINSDPEGRGPADCLIITTDLEILGT